MSHIPTNVLAKKGQETRETTTVLSAINSNLGHPTPVPAQKFKAGQIFNDKVLWGKLIDATKECGGFVDKTAESVVRKGLVNVRHKVVFNHAKTNVKFPHSKARDSYPNFDAMTAHFRSMTENDRNYSLCKQRPGCMIRLLNRMIEEGGLKILLPQDKEAVVLNPVNLLVKENGKTMLLVHYSQCLSLNSDNCVINTKCLTSFRRLY